MKVSGMLRFVFAGYSIWLEPEQFHSDLASAIQVASKEVDTYPIPAPHVTLIYGMSDLSEKEMIKRFRVVFSNEVRTWPTLRHKGFISDIALDGVNGGLMVNSPKLKRLILKTLIIQPQTSLFFARRIGHGMDGSHVRNVCRT
jgi:hypothetical protein